MAKRALRLQTEEVLKMLYESTTDMQCSDYSSDSGDDEPMMVGSDDQFSDLDTEDTGGAHEIESVPNVAGKNTYSDLVDFQLFFSDEMLDGIVDASNEYAKVTMPAEKVRKWEKYTVNDLKAYLGFQTLMSINRLPSYTDYWSKNPNMRYRPVADRISRDRFRELQRYLHFIDSTTIIPRGQTGHDRLGKIRPILTYVTRECNDVYSPSKEVTVDEAMIKFQGRCSLQQYLPMKPIKRGIKVWVLADSCTGYFFNFSLYTGKEGNKIEQGLCSKVMKTLTTSLKGLYHHVYFNNYFTSIALIEDLLSDGIYSCGVARKDRKYFPPQLSEAKLNNRFNSMSIQPMIYDHRLRCCCNFPYLFTT
ncbi:hypothetical protein EMCRGX_G016237 [Ephydatia muelleri]